MKESKEVYTQQFEAKSFIPAEKHNETLRDVSRLKKQLEYYKDEVEILHSQIEDLQNLLNLYNKTFINDQYEKIDADKTTEEE